MRKNGRPTKASPALSKAARFLLSLNIADSYGNNFLGRLALAQLCAPQLAIRDILYSFRAARSRIIARDEARQALGIMDQDLPALGLDAKFADAQLAREGAGRHR